MALTLNIDTSTEYASICVADSGKPLADISNRIQKEHGGWLHPAIKEVMQRAGRTISELIAVGITTGPGSYTGLRIGMSTAKGLCYTLGIPLVGVNTLEAMAWAAVNKEEALLCPMIDARRMEVYTALYRADLSEILQPAAMILSGESFRDLLGQGRIIFFGNGAGKFSRIMTEENALFREISLKASDMALIIYNKYLKCDYLSIAYAEPLYLK